MNLAHFASTLGNVVRITRHRVSTFNAMHTKQTFSHQLLDSLDWLLHQCSLLLCGLSSCIQYRFCSCGFVDQRRGWDSKGLMKRMCELMKTADANSILLSEWIDYSARDFGYLILF